MRCHCERAFLSERSNLLKVGFSHLGRDCFGKKHLAMTKSFDLGRQKIQMRLPYMIWCERCQVPATCLRAANGENSKRTKNSPIRNRGTSDCEIEIRIMWLLQFVVGILPVQLPAQA